jgi:hypothetical protein
MVLFFIINVESLQVGGCGRSQVVAGAIKQNKADMSRKKRRQNRRGQLHQRAHMLPADSSRQKAATQATTSGQ